MADASDCRLSTSQWDRMHHASISLVQDTGEMTSLRVRVADEPDERSAGYQHICPEIIDLSAILFVYDRPIHVSFHMNNVHAALDIGFFDENGRLIEVIRMEPQTDEAASPSYYSSERDFQYALETPAGFYRDHGITSGTATLKLH